MAQENLTPKTVDEKVYKELQAEFTRKSQELADLKADHNRVKGELEKTSGGITDKDTQLITYKKQLEELRNVNKEWQTFYEQNFANPTSEPNTSTTTSQAGSESTTKAGETGNSDLKRRSDIDRLEKIVADVATELKTERMKNERTTAYLLQIGELSRKIPPEKLDIQKVLNFAKDKGIDNLQDAYEGAYKDDIINEMVETRVKTRLDEVKAAAAKEPLPPSSSGPTVWKPPSTFEGTEERGKISYEGAMEKVRQDLGAQSSTG